jgi:hypothetical protein
MPEAATATRLIPTTDVREGSALTYLGRPFVVVRIDPCEPHPTLGARRIAYDDRGRGIMLYDEFTTTVHV